MGGNKPERERCACPYCDAELEGGPMCTVCKVAVSYCPKCHKPVPCEGKVCPYCGTKLKEESPRKGG
ncbi:MAG: hypothetical protein HYX79_10720 [Chloroflexi bacterium]|nr:hypothetical protein [Chloroflexota bacterium]